MVVIGRGVDLSLVAVMAVSLTVAVVLANSGYPFGQALLFGLAFVIGVAAVMGFLIAYVEVPAIFATLAVSAIVYGAGRGIVAKLDVNNLPNGLDWFVFLGRGTLLGIPMPIYAFAAAALLLYLFLQRTGLGIHKPWAPTRSYGLEARLDAACQPVAGAHSRANGRRHGVTAMVESGARLLVASKGAGQIIALNQDLEDAA